MSFATLHQFRPEYKAIPFCEGSARYAVRHIGCTIEVHVQLDNDLSTIFAWADRTDAELQIPFETRAAALLWLNTALRHSPNTYRVVEWDGVEPASDRERERLEQEANR